MEPFSGSDIYDRNSKVRNEANFLRLCESGFLQLVLVIGGSSKTNFWRNTIAAILDRDDRCLIGIGLQSIRLFTAHSLWQNRISAKQNVSHALSEIGHIARDFEGKAIQALGFSTDRISRSIQSTKVRRNLIYYCNWKFYQCRFNNIFEVHAIPKLDPSSSVSSISTNFVSPRVALFPSGQLQNLSNIDRSSRQFCSLNKKEFIKFDIFSSHRHVIWPHIFGCWRKKVFFISSIEKFVIFLPPMSGKDEKKKWIHIQYERCQPTTQPLFQTSDILPKHLTIIP